MEAEGTAEEATAVLSSENEVYIVGNIGSCSEIPSHRLAEL